MTPRHQFEHDFSLGTWLGQMVFLEIQIGQGMNNLSPENWWKNPIMDKHRCLLAPVQHRLRVIDGNSICL